MEGKSGQRIGLTTTGATLCGAGSLISGDKGTHIYNDTRKRFDGFLYPEIVPLLVQHGIIKGERN